MNSNSVRAIDSQLLSPTPTHKWKRVRDERGKKKKKKRGKRTLVHGRRVLYSSCRDIGWRGAIWGFMVLFCSINSLGVLGIIWNEGMIEAVVLILTCKARERLLDYSRLRSPR